MIGIYKFTNKINGMSYIGQSVDIERRYKQHKRINTGNTIFHNAIREYGFEAFDFEIIELCTKDSLDEKEKIYIKKYNTVYPKGYNIATGGHTGHPVKLNPDNDLKEIIELLETTDMTNEEIGSLYSVSSKIISMINTGRAWHDDNINYPIRKRNEYFCKDCGKNLYAKILIIYVVIVGIKGNHNLLFQKMNYIICYVNIHLHTLVKFLMFQIIQ